MSGNDFLTTAVRCGVAAAVATTTTIAMCGRREENSPWAPLNAVSHIAWGDEAALHVAPSWKYSATGAALNAAAMLLWGGVFAYVIGRGTRRTASRAVSAGIATAAIAYVVDYHVVPERLQPGFEKRLSREALLAIYMSLAAGLAAGELLVQRER